MTPAHRPVPLSKPAAGGLGRTPKYRAERAQCGPYEEIAREVFQLMEANLSQEVLADLAGTTNSVTLRRRRGPSFTSYHSVCELLLLPVSLVRNQPVLECS